MGTKIFWIIIGLGIIIWALISPNLVRALIGMFLFLIGVLINEDLK
jgi:hypothetical protein